MFLLCIVVTFAVKFLFYVKTSKADCYCQYKIIKQIWYSSVFKLLNTFFKIFVISPLFNRRIKLLASTFHSFVVLNNLIKLYLIPEAWFSFFKKLVRFINNQPFYPVKQNTKRILISHLLVHFHSDYYSIWISNVYKNLWYHKQNI